jgi:hypothetical protein
LRSSLTSDGDAMKIVGFINFLKGITQHPAMTLLNERCILTQLLGES